MENKKYSGYLCKKCFCIPFFEIINNKSDIKIFSACKCNKHYEKIDTFIKNKYIEEFSDINKILNEPIINVTRNDKIKIEKQFEIDFIMNDFINNKKKLNEAAENIKKQLYSIYKKKLENFNKMYNKYIINNNKIILVIQKLIDSYKIFKNHPSIIENIINNCNFNIEYDFNKVIKEFNSSIESAFKNFDDYFNNKLIISNIRKSTIYKRNKRSNYKFSNNYINYFIELDNDMCATCHERKNNITLYDLKNEIEEKITFKAHSKYTYGIVKSKNNNIISIGDDGLIKIWPIINKYLLNDSKNPTNININNKNKIEFELTPIFEYKYYNPENPIKIDKILNLKNDSFLTATKAEIDIYKYSMNNNDIKLEKINHYENQILNVFIIERNKKEIIALCSNQGIYFLNIDDLKIINHINIKLIFKNGLLQLNSDEILIIHNHLNIYDINNFQFKLKIKTYNDIDYLINLNDGTFIFSCFGGIKRYLIKTMEELPQIIKFNTNNFFESYDYYDYDYDDYYAEKVVYLYQLKDKRIVVCYKDGNIEILNIKY